MTEPQERRKEGRGALGEFSSSVRLHSADKPKARAGDQFAFLNKTSSFRKTLRPFLSSRIRARDVKEAD